MSLAGRLRPLQARGVAFKVHGGALHYRDPEAVLSEAEASFLRERGHEIVLEVARSRTPPDDTVPLTFQQEFALERCGNAFYGVLTTRLCGSLNVDGFRASVRALIERHGALRTQIIVTATGVGQRVLPPDAYDFKRVYLGGETATDPAVVAACLDEQLGEWLQEAQSAFAVRLIQIAPEEHVLLVLWDHLFADYVSMVLVFEELWKLYQTVQGQAVPPLVPTPMQYADYAAWQRREYPTWLQRHRGYWSERLKGAVPVQLPVAATQETGTARPARAVVRLSFGSELSDSLRELARRKNVNMPSVVVTLVALGLAAWSGQRRFALPMTFSGRYYRDHLNIVGYLPNFMPLRVDFEDSVTFGAVCSVIAREFLTSIAHLDIGMTVDGGVPELLHSPFVQWFPSSPLPTEAILPPASSWNAQALGLAVEPFVGDWRPPASRGREFDFPLYFLFWEGQIGIEGLVCFQPSLYPTQRIEQFAQDVVRRATQIVGDPEAPLEIAQNLPKAS